VKNGSLRIKAIKKRNERYGTLAWKRPLKGKQGLVPVKWSHVLDFVGLYYYPVFFAKLNYGVVISPIKL
jgi:hypothetical protein